MRRFDHLFMLIAVLLLWQVAFWSLGDVALASPMATLRRLVTLLDQASFRLDAAGTAWAFAISATVSVLGGVLLGGLLGLSRLTGRVVGPVMASFYALPKVTLYPVVLLLFGLGEPAKVAFGIMHGLVPIALVTMNAVLQVRPVHLRTAAALRLRRDQVLLCVVLPAALPEVLGGVRIGVPLALLGVLIGEMFASRRGLGAVAMQAMERNDPPTLLAVAVLLAGAALCVNAALARVSARGAGSQTVAR